MPGRGQQQRHRFQSASPAAETDYVGEFLIEASEPRVEKIVAGIAVISSQPLRADESERTPDLGVFVSDARKKRSAANNLHIAEVLDGAANAASPPMPNWLAGYGRLSDLASLDRLIDVPHYVGFQLVDLDEGRAIDLQERRPQIENPLLLELQDGSNGCFSGCHRGFLEERVGGLRYPWSGDSQAGASARVEAAPDNADRTAQHTAQNTTGHGWDAPPVMHRPVAG
jgi:hypothetical protein